MDTLLNDFERSISYDSQHYASNDSGLSSNSNGCVENDSKFTTLLDFHCDDLTKSLFINSIGDNELIHDDDIYSYKNKLEIQNMFNNKFRSFNFLKSDNFKIRNSCSFSSIIHDLENLKESEPLSRYPNKITTTNITLKDKNSNYSSIVRPSEDHLNYMKCDSFEKNKLRKPIKKTRQPHNNIQEYVSSSVKNYKGNQSLNELVQFIQGTPSTSKQSSKSKTEKISTNKSDINANTAKSIQLSIISDSAGNSEHESPVSKQSSITNSLIIDGDSGTQSHFVSLNNSDEDSHKIIINDDFQEVVAKNRKKQKRNPSNPPLPPAIPDHGDKLANNCSNKTKSSNKTLKPQKKCQKMKNFQTLHTASAKSKSVDLLDTKDSLQKFLSNQYSIFVKLSATVS